MTPKQLEEQQALNDLTIEEYCALAHKWLHGSMENAPKKNRRICSFAPDVVYCENKKEDKK